MGVKKHGNSRRPVGLKAKQPPQQADVKHKVLRAFQLAKKAADKARTFDIQKLVKRLKDARSETTTTKPRADTDPQALEAQIQALKDLPNDYIAHVALLSKIRKDKGLAANEEIAAALTGIPAPTAPSKKSRDDEIVQSRVLSSKHLSSAIQDALASLRPPTSASQSLKLKTKALAGQSESDSETYTSDEDKDDNSDTQNHVGEDNEDESQDEALDIVMDNDVDMDEDEDEDAAANADGWESGTVNSETHDSDAEHTKVKQATKVSGKGASSSIFLPSLSVGFARGDSDSDWSDGEAKAADGVRKNRRGQRARQAIWEKKYGRGAKHVQKRVQMEARAAAYANVRRGRGTVATRGRSAPRGARGNAPPSHDPRTQRAPTVSTAPKPMQVEKPMHPSWEAKQKQKTAAAIVPSQGKKIVF